MHNAAFESIEKISIERGHSISIIIDKIKLWDDEEDLDEMGRDSIVATNKVVPVKPKLIKIGFISG